MSDLRFDPLSNQWCLVAPQRDKRPVEIRQVETVHKGPVCPFCSGNESETPEALAVYAHQPAITGHASSDASDWKLRVIPNKYASFGEKKDAPCDTASIEGCSGVLGGSEEHGPYRVSSLPGLQELILPTPRHVATLSALDEDESKLLWEAAQARICAMREAGIAKHAMLFMNCRAQAGASLEHIHIQLMGSPVVSDYLAGRVDRNRKQLESTGQTLVAAILDWELKQQLRVIETTEHFAVVCPFASRFAYQIRIMPLSSEVSFLDLGVEARDELAELCRSMTSRIEGVLQNPPYNLLLQIAPFEDLDDDHWYVEILPRTTRSAGFELGTDVWVNPMPPETAAQQLR